MPQYHFRITGLFLRFGSYWCNCFIIFGEPAGTRTQDPRLKRALLYQLSYELTSDSRVTQFDNGPRAGTKATATVQVVSCKADESMRRFVAPTDPTDVTPRQVTDGEFLSFH